MTTQTQGWSAWSSATISLDSLTSANYVASSAVDLSAVDALDIIVQAVVVVGTVSGNKRCAVFVQVSNDGSTYSTGPTSGTTTTDEPDLYRLGDVPCNTSSAT